MMQERSEKPEGPGTRALLEYVRFVGGSVFFLGGKGWGTGVGWGLLISVQPREGPEGLFMRIPNPPLEVLFKNH